MSKYELSKPSHLKKLVLTSITTMVIFFLLSIDLPAFVVAMNVFLIAGYYFYRFSFNNDSIQSIQKIGEHTWNIEFKSGKSFNGKLQNRSLSTTWLSIIILKSSSSWYSRKIVIFKDVLSQEQYHQLQLQLKGLLH